jgi:hypothetical protein
MLKGVKLCKYYFTSVAWFFKLRSLKKVHFFHETCLTSDFTVHMYMTLCIGFNERIYLSYWGLCA